LILQTLKQHATTLEHLKANNADLEKDVQRVQERKKLLEKVTVPMSLNSLLPQFVINFLGMIINPP
jgi:hypothetical protein